MALAALLGALLLWLTFGGKVLRDRRNWPGLAALLGGMVMLADARPALGLGLIAVGALWLRWPRRWLRAARATARPSTRDRARESALAEARALLGLPPEAGREAVIAAHRRLIARNHPDSGGTEALAARLNAARDLLLRQGGTNG